MDHHQQERDPRGGANAAEAEGHWIGPEDPWSIAAPRQVHFTPQASTSIVLSSSS